MPAIVIANGTPKARNRGSHDASKAPLSAARHAGNPAIAETEIDAAATTATADVGSPERDKTTYPMDTTSTAFNTYIAAKRHAMPRVDRYSRRSRRPPA